MASAYSPAADHVNVSLDYYRLLQVSKSASRDAVRKAYEHLVRLTPAAAYSQETLFSRAVLLKAAAECLVDMDLRRSYDQRVANGNAELKVPMADLPGALALLHECGDTDTVIAIAEEWLNKNNVTHPDAPDVAASLALAFCDKAGDLLERASPATFSPAYEYLERAYKVLRTFQISTQLQGQISDTLTDMGPEYTLELLELPLGPTHAAARAKGLGLLKSLAMGVTADGQLAGTQVGQPAPRSSVACTSWTMHPCRSALCRK